MGGIYGQWSAWLADFAENREDAPLASLPAARIEDLGAKAAARLCQRCAVALNERLRKWDRSFLRDMERVRSANEMRQALSSARSRLIPLRALADSPLLFEDLRSDLQAQLQKVLGETQENLESHAQRQGGHGEMLLRIVREQPLDRAVSMDLQASVTAQARTSTARQVLIG